MSELEEKYIKLLLLKCLDLDTSKPLFISYDVINKDFVEKVVKVANQLGVSEIYLDENSIVEEHDILKRISMEDIDKCCYSDNSIWNQCAKMDASFLILKTYVPNIMDDIDPEKLSRLEFIKRKSVSFYKKRQLSYEIPWCIAALPNELWARSMFKNSENALELLENSIYEMCMVNTENPILSWNKHLNRNKKLVEKLNDLKIRLLHYKNGIGTDLIVGLTDDRRWCDASSNGLVNMPSYEIFTSPDYEQTSGIVYSSRPLVYSGGLIDNFWIKFKDGKVVECGAEKGEELLKSIINSDSNSCYLGECALVENNSPISQTGLVYGLTLFDENASCHLALGAGFPECIENGSKYNQTELLERGINVSKVHVDFMIGTKDLNIEADTNKGKILVFKNGNFNI